MKKRYITIVVIWHVVFKLYILFLFAVFLFIIISILDLKNKGVKDKTKMEQIENSLCLYQHSQRLLFSYEDYLINYNKMASIGTGYKILSIGDDYIFSYDIINSKYSISYYSGRVKNIDINSISGSYDSIIMEDEMIYSSVLNKYYQYNLITDIEEEIYKEKYYIIKNGKDYDVSKSKKNVIVYNNLSHENKVISLEDIASQPSFSSELQLMSFEILDYKMVGDNIYLNMNYKEICIIIRYNFITNIYELYDWNRFVHDFDYNYKNINFYIMLNDQSPSIINKYFIL